MKTDVLAHRLTQAALRAVDPAQAIRQIVHVAGDRLTIKDRSAEIVRI